MSVRFSLGKILLTAALPLTLAGALVTAAALQLDEPGHGWEHSSSAAGGLTGASEAQRQALADGEVTADEYRAAADAFVACVEERVPGVAVIRHPVAGGREIFEFAYDAGRVAAGHEANQACWELHLDAVDRAWSAIAQPDAAYLQTARDALGARLRARGVAVPASPTQADLTEVLRGALSGTVPNVVVRECSEAVGEQYQLPGFFG